MTPATCSLCAEIVCDYTCEAIGRQREAPGGYVWFERPGRPLHIGDDAGLRSRVLCGTFAPFAVATPTDVAPAGAEVCPLCDAIALRMEIRRAE